MDESMIKALVESASLVGVLATWVYLERQSHRENLMYYRSKIAECAKEMRDDLREFEERLSDHIANSE